MKSIGAPALFLEHIHVFDSAVQKDAANSGLDVLLLLIREGAIQPQPLRIDSLGGEITYTLSSYGRRCCHGKFSIRGRYL